MSHQSFGAAPLTICIAGAVVALQGCVGVVVAVVLLVRTLAGSHESATIGYGTAAMFAVLGVGVLAGGVALLQSRRGGRGPALVVQVVLLPVAWSLLTASAQVLLGLLLGAVVLATLGLLLAAPSRQWMAEQYPAASAPDDDAN